MLMTASGVKSLAIILAVCVTYPILAKEGDANPVLPFDMLGEVIPPGLKVRGPLQSVEPGVQRWHFYEEDTKIVKMSAEVKNQRLIYLASYGKAWQSDGYTKRWYEDGVPQEELSYKNGVLDGISRHWDTEDRLIGRYELNNGTGTVRVFHVTGWLAKHKEYVGGKLHGASLQYYKTGELQAIYNYSNNFPVGRGIEYYDNGKVYYAIQRNDAGKPHGMEVFYTKGGNLHAIKYYVTGKEVSRDEYEQKAADDDLLQEASWATELNREGVHLNIQADYKKYSQQTKEKLPLEGY